MQRLRYRQLSRLARKCFIVWVLGIWVILFWVINCFWVRFYWQMIGVWELLDIMSFGLFSSFINFRLVSRCQACRVWWEQKLFWCQRQRLVVLVLELSVIVKYQSSSIRKVFRLLGLRTRCGLMFCSLVKRVVLGFQW